MERTRISNSDQIRWKNTGNKFFRLKNGTKVKPGDVFFAPPDYVAVAFRDIIKPLDQILPKEEAPIEVIDVVFKIQKRGSSNWYDVVDRNGKVKNTKALKKDDAIEMIKNLEG